MDLVVKYGSENSENWIKSNIDSKMGNPFLWREMIEISLFSEPYFTTKSIEKTTIPRRRMLFFSMDLVVKYESENDENLITFDIEVM